MKFWSVRVYRNWNAVGDASALTTKQNRMRSAAVPAMHPKMMAAIAPAEIDLDAAFPEVFGVLPLIVWVGFDNGLVSEGVDWRELASFVVVVDPIMVVGFWTESEDVVLVVEGTFDEDEDDVAEVFGGEDEGDEPKESDGGMLDEVLCSTGVDVGVGVVNGGELGGLAEDVGGAVGVALVVVSER
jgi:hypothetical protein